MSGVVNVEFTLGREIRLKHPGGRVTRLAWDEATAEFLVEMVNMENRQRAQLVDELDENGYPILDAYERNDGYGLAVWCRCCRRWHVHGHGAGHRVEHCHREDSPYMKTGYVLRPIGKPVPTFNNGRPRPPEGS